MLVREKFMFGGALLLLGLLTSCGDAPQADVDITDTSAAQMNAGQNDGQKAEGIKTIFRAVPSPMEMSAMLKQSGAKYDASLLNDVKKANSYNTSRSQALNLGIYGANLSYASVFNQNQESIIYLSCAKKLADNLGVSKAFDEETIERMETNIDNRDSLLNIVSEAYYMLDAYLKENGREHISAMVIAAGWIEGLHISTSIASRATDPSDELMNRIADQKVSLKNLIELVKSYNAEGQIDEVMNDLLTLQAIFAEAVQIEKGASKVEKDSDGVAVIGATTTATFSPDGLEKIHAGITEIRTRYVS